MGGGLSGGLQKLFEPLMSMFKRFCSQFQNAFGNFAEAIHVGDNNLAKNFTNAIGGQNLSTVDPNGSMTPVVQKNTLQAQETRPQIALNPTGMGMSGNAA